MRNNTGFQIGHSPIELQNCLEEANNVRADRAAFSRRNLQVYLDLGFFVVVEEVPYFCKSTDACAGVVPTMHNFYHTRDAADAAANELSSAGVEGMVYVLPRLTVAAAPVQDDTGVPF